MTWDIIDLSWLVVSTHLKNISQLGRLFPIYGKINNDPNTNQFRFLLLEVQLPGKRRKTGWAFRKVDPIVLWMHPDAIDSSMMDTCQLTIPKKTGEQCSKSFKIPLSFHYIGLVYRDSPLVDYEKTLIDKG